VRSGYVTFGSLNNYCKVTVPTLAAWSAILARVERARLLMLVDTDSDGVKRLVNRLEASGIDRRRVQIERRMPYSKYFDLFRSIDVALDTFPYNGHTTTCDALWMGVPVVTQAGQRHVSRVGASLLSALDRKQWIAATTEQYIENATNLISNVKALINQRATLRRQMVASALTDAPAFTRKFESALRDRVSCIEG
jgi:protein O-GlcNAc transferase